MTARVYLGGAIFSSTIYRNPPSSSSQSRADCSPFKSCVKLHKISGNLPAGRGSQLGAPREPSLASSCAQIEPVTREHFRKRDNFTQYVEASSRYKLLMKAKAAEGGPPSPPAARAAPAPAKSTTDKPASA